MLAIVSPFLLLPVTVCLYLAPDGRLLANIEKANDLVAVGDEGGSGVKLLDTSVSGSAQFSRIHLSFPAHDNAIIDLAFSADDNLLATASGDQTVKVIDMTSQDAHLGPGRPPGVGQAGVVPTWPWRRKHSSHV